MIKKIVSNFYFRISGFIIIPLMFLAAFSHNVAPNIISTIFIWTGLIYIILTGCIVITSILIEIIKDLKK